MALFQSVLMLMLLAILSLQVSRRLRIPYPTMLAVAGLGVAMLPSAPTIAIEPRLVMALFIAPAILDAAYDFPPRAIRRHWLPLFALAVIAVLLTTAAVAWVGIVYAGLPLAAAIALGAIVAPPDAAAAAAMLDRPDLPRSTVTVLKGESLLNDAVALFVFSVALHMGTMDSDAQRAIPQLALAIPGGLLLGMAMGRLATITMPLLAGTMGGILFSFVITFGTWILADQLGLSAILAMVAAAMTVARRSDRQAARDRIHSYAVWDLMVFVLNVLAFLFVGLQARAIVQTLDDSELHHAIGFAALVFATVVGVRILWVMLYNRLVQPVYRWLGYGAGPTLKQGIVASWCGMRGMVTLAAALALPETFPQRGLVVLSALAVVLGTLIVQGITLGPLIRLLRFPIETTQRDELERARLALTAVAEAEFDKAGDAAAALLREELRLEQIALQSPYRQSENPVDTLRLSTIRTQRAALWRMLRDNVIDDETYDVLERELDLGELAASRRQPFDLVDG
ncbi:sodium:proton antiporter [Pseudolysobacter antarcticus]|uniref:Sodium:proton antiporter n=1 Tax=Pseudolysobacter antarcticus TaxID=2511995 RepID=A0A411HEV8_9GAMM|nr:cation:proton antiporter [Pseudolysobacter antarcticus]QBB69020.1 sodium:proton antiporter [Pseudolysobacter antarcticus]